MTAELRRGLILAILGLLAGLVLVAGLLGDGRLSLARLAGDWRSLASREPAALPATPPVADPVGRGSTSPPPANVPGPAADASKPDAAASAAGARPADLPASAGSSQANGVAPAGEAGRGQGPAGDASKPVPASTATASADAAKPAAANGKPPQAPSFDVIRVEPTGDTVVAGRGAPGATIEMLRGGEPFARALADPSGLFAIVPPMLPKGTSEISLRMIGPDGVRTTSKDTAIIVVPAQGASKPLIALTSPDKPTVVLSQPETPVAATGAPGSPASAAPVKPAGQTPVKVVSVDAESGGRLFVTAQAPPGATVRLYLNDTLVAPASAGPDGRVAFAIGRGVQSGQYRVRIDQVDPVSGEVRNRSEVPFSFPLALANPPAPSVSVLARSPEAEARVQQRVDDLARSRPAPQAPSGQGAPPAAAAGVSPGAAPSTSPAPVASAPPPAAGGSPAPLGAPGRDTVYVPELSTLTVTRGDNLWDISRRSYGRGARYTVIYDANQPQIRNPALIYPGQIFVLPQQGKDAQSGQAVQQGQAIQSGQAPQQTQTR